MLSRHGNRILNHITQIEKQYIAKKPNIHMSKSTPNFMGTNCKIHIMPSRWQVTTTKIFFFFYKLIPRVMVQPLLAHHLALKHTLSYTCTHNLCSNFISLLSFEILMIQGLSLKQISQMKKIKFWFCYGLNVNNYVWWQIINKNNIKFHVNQQKLLESWKLGTC